MAKHRSFKMDKFIMSVEDELLRRYFSEVRGITVPPEAKFDEESFDKFWNGLSKKDQAEIEEELQCINDVADRSRGYLEDAIHDYSIPRTDTDSPATVAMRVFLRGEDAFSKSFDHYLYVVYSEKLSHHKFYQGVADFTATKVAEFKSEVIRYFKECGKSENCDIRERFEGGKHILLVARGDFMDTHLVFEGGKMKIASFRPAREDMLVFDPVTSLLSINVGAYSDNEKIKYIEIFGKTIMGLSEIDERTKNDTIVILDPIKNNTFEYGGNGHVEAVKLTEVRVKQKGVAPIKLTVNYNDVTRLFSRYNLSSDGTEFLSAKLRFTVKREGKKPKNITVEIKPPKNTEVPEKAEKKIIEDYLRDQGIFLA